MIAHVDEANNPSTRSCLARAQAGQSYGTSLNERSKQYVDIYAFLFSQLDMRANAKK